MYMAICDAERRLYQGVLYLQNVTHIDGTRVNLITFVLTKKYGVRSADFSRNVQTFNIARISLAPNSIPRATNVGMNGIWVRALPVPMHIGLRAGPLCPIFYY